MQQENKRSKAIAVIFWILTAICMAIIFYFSSRPANQSAGQSSVVTLFLQKLFHTKAITEHMVRKFAHFTEFAGLGFLINTALYCSTGKQKLPLGIAIGSAYAGTDEIHQIFVDGRSCQFTDWALDTAGIVTGAIIFLILNLIIRKIIEHKKEDKKI
ncbi:VanZ family protein [uncultured Eubacterium sp.]|uniref:VanZ family protein n=1 Tax=uncultured Eubacterium sp. TaxID=165185 RepID=UPI002583377A|nr:VanZ family protein [uncultured Eubacterium sp.]